jgi:hypothetical protein
LTNFHQKHPNIFPAVSDARDKPPPLQENITIKSLPNDQLKLMPGSLPAFGGDFSKSFFQ